MKLAKRYKDHGKGWIVELGYIHIESIKPGDLLFTKDDYWSAEDEKWAKGIAPDEIVIKPNKEFTLVIDYPLSKPFTIKLKSGTKGITREGMVNRIVKYYKKVYANASKYGIWGHDLGDLVLGSVILFPDGTVRLGVDS